MFYCICYDIVDDRRRLAVAKVLRDFGERVQYSVFEAHLDDDQVQRIKKRVNKILDMKEDSLRFYPLCAACETRVEVLGLGTVTQDPDFIVI